MPGAERDAAFRQGWKADLGVDTLRTKEFKMLQSEFEQTARYITARNLTPNVTAVAAKWSALTNHLHVIYYLSGPATDDDEEEREMTISELVAAFPAIQTASSAFGSADDLKSGGGRDLVFARS